MKTTVAIIIIAILSMYIVVSANPMLIQTIEENREYLYASVGIGSSMEPHIQNGDTLVILKKESPKYTVNIGDIVVYKDDAGRTIAHRIFSISGIEYRVKGDNTVNCEAIYEKQIIGKVIEIISHNNYIGKAVIGAML